MIRRPVEMVVKNSDSRIPQDVFLWHTFGNHGDETEAEIIHRKENEIANSEFGYTLWTIAMQAQGKMLDNWRDQLMRQSERGFAYVVCGGDAIRGSKETPEVATHYTRNLMTKDNWGEIPQGIQATRKKLGTTASAAFVVADIQAIGEPSELTVNWWDQKSQKWAKDRPAKHTRDGVKLLRKSIDGKPIIDKADCRYILKLEYPYFVMVRKFSY